MRAELTIATAHTNPTFGDIRATWRASAPRRCRPNGRDLVVYSELVVVGYPPGDLVIKPALQNEAGVRSSSSPGTPPPLPVLLHALTVGAQAYQAPDDASKAPSAELGEFV